MADFTDIHPRIPLFSVRPVEQRLQDGYKEIRYLEDDYIYPVDCEYYFGQISRRFDDNVYAVIYLSFSVSGEESNICFGKEERHSSGHPLKNDNKEYGPPIDVGVYKER